MECVEAKSLLDDYLDGGLDDRQLREHLSVCADCRGVYEHARAVQEAFRKLSPPEVHPAFVDRALLRATRPSAPAAHPQRRALIGMAVAASLVLGLSLGAFFSLRDAPVQTVALAIERPETVRMIFDSAKPLRAATVSLALPDNVEVVGYAGQRELTWQTDLREGRNLLQLPLIARGTVKDDLLARLSHGGSTKTFRVKFEMAKASTQGMQ